MKRYFWVQMMCALLVLVGVSAVAVEAATISGMVTNSTNKSGRVYVALSDQYGNKNLGVSKTIAAIGTGDSVAFSISGVPNGTYTLSAFLDVRYGGKDSGIRHANDAYVQYGSQLTVNGNQSGLNMTLAKPSPISLTTQLADFSTNFMASTDGTGVLIFLPDLQMSGSWPNELPIPEAVVMTCSGSGLASTSATIIMDSWNQMALFKGLTPGGTLSCTAVPVVNGALDTTHQRISTASIAAATGGSTVTGTYSITGITPGATTPLYIVLTADKNVPPILAVITSPTTSGTFTINNVPPGHYRVQGVVDANNSHVIDAGDLSLRMNMTPIVVIDGSEGAVPVKGGKIVFTKSGSFPELSVQHEIDTTQVVPGERFNLSFQFERNSCLITGVSLANGVNGTLAQSPVSLGINSWGGVDYWANGSSTRPDDTPATAGHYLATIEYADSAICPTETVDLQVLRINDDFARPSFPKGTVVDNNTLNAAWRVPNPQPYYYNDYKTGLGNNSGDGDGLPPSTLSGYLGSLGSNTQWNLQSRDMLGNTATWRQSFTVTGTGPQIADFNPKTGINSTTTSGISDNNGTQVIITGSGFKPAGLTPVVKFNGGQAIVSASTDTSITVRVANSASLGPITVTTGGVTGVTGISSAVFTPMISFGSTGTNFVTDSTGVAVPGVLVHAIGVSAASATTDSLGYYNITNVTAGMPLDFKLSKSGYLDSYSNFQAQTGNVTSANYGMFTAADLTTWNVAGVDWTGTVSAANPPAAAMTNVIAGSRGIIRTRTVDANNSNNSTNGLAGVVVDAYSWRNKGQLYKVVYGDPSGTGAPNPALTSTSTSGRFYVLDVDAGDFVTVVAEKNGYIFRPRGYNVRSGAVSQGAISGALAPIVTITPPPNPQDVSPLAITLTATNTNTIIYTVNGTDPRYFGSNCANPCAIQLNPPVGFSNAAVTVRATAMAAGVYGDQVWATYNLIQDTTPPTVQANPPGYPVVGSAFGYSKTAPISVTFTANEPSTIWYTTNGNSPFTDPSRTSLPVATSGGTTIPISVSSGTNVKFYGVDTANNTSAQQTVTMIYDNVAPTISSITYNGFNFTNMYSTTNVQFGINASDNNSPNTTISYLVTTNNTPTPLMTDPGWSTSNWVTASNVLAEGFYTRYVWVKDGAGNIILSPTTVSFTVDSTKPAQPTITAFTNNRVNNNNPTVTGSAEANSSVVLYEGASPLAGGPTDGLGAWAAGLPFLSEGSSHTVTAVAIDAAGNSSPVSDPITFTIDTGPPTTTATSNPVCGGATKCTQPISVTLAANEPAAIYYTTNGADPTYPVSGQTHTYVSALPVTVNTILKFRARDLAGNLEDVKTVTYSFGDPTTLSLGLGGLSNITYGDSLPATATITSGVGPTGTVQFFVDGSPYGAAVPLSGTLATNVITGLQVAGSPHSITASYGGDATYAGSTTPAATVTVVKAASSVTVTGTTTFTYTGAPQGPSTSTVTGSTGAVSYSYSGTGATSYGPSATAPTNAGTYSVTATVATDANYNSASSSATPFSIAKATPTVTVTAGIYTYNGSAQGPGTAVVNKGGSTGAVTLSYSGSGATSYGPSATAPTNAGTYSVTATVAADTNYNSASSSATAFSIAKATPTVTVTAGTYTYNGSAQGPGTADVNKGGSTGAVTLSYSGSGTTSYGPSATAPTNAGTYSVTATVAADANDNNASSSATAFSIAKAATSVTVTGTTTFTYTGAAQGPSTSTVTGSTGAVSYSYSGTGATIYGPSATAPTFAGTYSVTATVVADANYNAASSSATAFSIAKAVSSVTVTGTTTFTYTGAAQGPATATVTGSTGAVSYSYSGSGATSYGPSANAPTNAGTYSVTATVVASANYNSATSSATAFSIAKAAQVIAINTQAPSSAAVNSSFTVAASAPGGSVAYSSPSTSVCTNTPGTGTFTMIASIGTCVVQYDQGGSINYNQAPQRTSNTPATNLAQTINVTTPALTSAPYGSQFTVNATAPGGAVVYSSGDINVCTNSNATFTMVSGSGTCIVQYDQSGNANYAAAVRVINNTTATKASQSTVTVSAPASAIYGEAGLTATASGGSGTGAYSYSAGTSTACTVNASSGALTITSGTGTCSITATRTADTNYNVSAASAASPVAIGKATQAAVTVVTPASAVYGQTGLSATASGGSGSGVYNYSAGSSTACSVIASTGALTFSNGTGTCSITATRTADTNYNVSAASAASIFAVGKATQATVTVSTPTSVVYGQTGLSATASGGSGTGAYNYSAGSSTACSVNSTTGALTILSAGSCSVTANRSADANYYASAASAAATFTIGKATPLITWANPANISYGTTLGATQLNATSSVAGTFNYAQPSGTKLLPGLQTMSVNFIPSDNANYNSVNDVKKQILVLNPTGDIDGNGLFDIADALKMLNMSVGASAAQLGLPAGYLDRGDIGPYNGTNNSVPNGLIDSGDAIVMLRKIVGLISWI